MAGEEQNEFIAEFLSESDEHLQVLNDKMLQLEEATKTGVEMSKDVLNTMFRAAHTIKGTASFIGLNKVVRLTHKTETLLQQLRDGAMGLTAEIVDALFAAFDRLSSLLDSLRASKGEEADIEADVQKIEAILSGQAAPAATAAAPTVSVLPTEAPATPQSTVTPPPPPAPKVLPKAAPVVTVLTGIQEKYLEQFIVEAEQNVDDVEGLLLAAEEGNGDLENVAIIFRSMHTIKGSAGVVNIQPISEVAHKMENILGVFRERQMTLAAETATLLLRGLDCLRTMLKTIKATRTISVDIVAIGAELDAFFDSLTAAQKKAAAPAVVVEISEEKIAALCDIATLSHEQKAVLADIAQRDGEVYGVTLLIEKNVPIKSMKAVIVEERLKRNGILIRMNPSPEALERTENVGDLYVGVLFSTGTDERDIRSLLSVDGVRVLAVMHIEDVAIKKVIGQETPAPVVQRQVEKKGAGMEEAGVEIKPQLGTATKSVAPLEISTIKIDSRKLDTLMNLSGELVIIRAQFARLVNLFNTNVLQQKEVVRVYEKVEGVLEQLSKEIDMFQTDGSGEDKGAKKARRLLNEIRAVFAEIDQNIMKDDIIENIHVLDETTSSLEKVSSNIQSGVMQTRMVPIEGVFTRFKRIVRDISKDIGKDVNLIIEGAETELDKKIVDGLGDPLTHMIRNAIDHGIEDKQTRENLGKPATGTVILRASHKGNNICIEIGDDGRGIDQDKVCAKALEKGVLTQDQLDRMSDKEKLAIIFLPGFSTAEKVTGLSGRGVGMDVVKSMINSFNGVVDIDTKVGEGSKFALKIPLTLAIIQSLLVDIGGGIYAFPLESVTEIIKVSDQDVYSVDGTATVKLRSHALSIIDLEKVIKIKPNSRKEEKNKKVVIISDGESQLGVIVDDLVGKEEIVIKPFTRHFSNVKGLTGASILADGCVALILDPVVIMRESR